MTKQEFIEAFQKEKHFDAKDVGDGVLVRYIIPRTTKTFQENGKKMVTRKVIGAIIDESCFFNYWHDFCPFERTKHTLERSSKIINRVIHWFFPRYACTPTRRVTEEIG